MVYLRSIVESFYGIEFGKHLLNRRDFLEIIKSTKADSKWGLFIYLNNRVRGMSGKIFAPGLSLYRPSVARFARKTEGKYFPGQIEQTRLLRHLLHGFSFKSVKEKKHAFTLARNWSNNFPVLYGRLLDQFLANQHAGSGYWP